MARHAILLLLLLLLLLLPSTIALSSPQSCPHHHHRGHPCQQYHHQIYGKACSSLYLAPTGCQLQWYAPTAPAAPLLSNQAVIHNIVHIFLQNNSTLGFKYHRPDIVPVSSIKMGVRTRPPTTYHQLSRCTMPLKCSDILHQMEIH